jgi:hypothetical protein
MATKISEALIERALALMADGVPRTYRELGTALGESIMTGWRLVETLYARHRIYMKDFQRHARNGKITPIYALGNEPDAVCEDFDRQKKIGRECQFRTRSVEPFRSAFDIAFFGKPPALTGKTKWEGRTVRQSMSDADDEAEV